MNLTVEEVKHTNLQRRMKSYIIAAAQRFQEMENTECGLKI